MVWQILLVEDDAEIVEQIVDDAARKKLLPGSAVVEVMAVQDFRDAQKAMSNRRFDYLILDLRAETTDDDPDPSPGLKVFKELRKQRFVPVVFYTAVPSKVEVHASPFVRIVEKSAGLSHLRRELKALHNTRLPELLRYLEEEQRTYMWDFVEENAQEFGSGKARADFAYLLARRLSLKLSGDTVRKFLNGEVVLPSKKVHPMEVYVRPPMGDDWRAGDILKRAGTKRGGYFVVLSPTCDFINKKVEAALLAKCEQLSKQPEYSAWLTQGKSTTDRGLQTFLQTLSNGRANKRQQDRFRFLPGTFFMPDLVADFQGLIPTPLKDQARFKRMASLDSPFAEALLAQFGRYYLRIGTPDLDVEAVMARLSK